MALSLLLFGGIAAVSAAALNQTNSIERRYYENLSKDEVLTPQMTQNFPYTPIGVQLNSVNSHVRKFNVYGETPTRTFIGEFGTSTITGLGKSR